MFIRLRAVFVHLHFCTFWTWGWVLGRCWTLQNCQSYFWTVVSTARSRWTGRRTIPCHSLSESILHHSFDHATRCIEKKRATNAWDLQVKHTFVRVPECRNFLEPRQFVIELKVIFCKWQTHKSNLGHTCWYETDFNVLIRPKHETWRGFTSGKPSHWTCVCSHSSLSEFSFSRTPSLTWLQVSFALFNASTRFWWSGWSAGV